MSRPKESFENRKKAKQAERRRQHHDKYAGKVSGSKATTNPEAKNERQ